MNGSIVNDAIDAEELVNREIARLDYQANIEEAAKRLQYQFDYAQSALKALLLVNGGAMIALLTFVGNGKATFDKAALWWSFGSFSVGLFSALLAHFGAYFSQSFYMETTISQAWNAQRRMHGLEEPHDTTRSFKLGTIALRLGVLLATLSVLAFIGGAFVGLEGIL